MIPMRPVTAQLTYRLADGVLLGSAGGRLVHSLTRRPGGPVTMIRPGRFAISPPAEHPVFGWVAIAAPCGSLLPGGVNAFNLQPGGVHAFDLQPGGVHAFDLQPGSRSASPLSHGEGVMHPVMKVRVRDILLPTNESGGVGGQAGGGFVLAKSPLGANSLIVINGFDELLQDIALAGGASIDVVF